MQLKASNIEKIYNNQSEDKELLIFKNLEFLLSEEKIVTIYGPSGIGKSTFLNMIGTLDAPTKGSICLDGIKYGTKNYLKLRKKYIGYIFQSHYLLPEFTVYENIELALLIKGYSPSDGISKQIYSTLKAFNIEDKINAYPRSLSVGESQRVAISRAIINSPKIVLADEPTGNLDESNSSLIIEQIKKISLEKEIKFIIATHDKAFESISDVIYEIKDYKLHLKKV